MSNTTERSPVLPTDVFDRTLASLIGRPDGAHTEQSNVQHLDFYGNTSTYLVQTVKAEDGNTVFVQIVTSKTDRLIIPPKVLKVILRQQDAITAKLRHRHGRRLAEIAKANGRVPTFTPEARKKGLATRRAKAAKRRARKARATS